MLNVYTDVLAKEGRWSKPDIRVSSSVKGELDKHFRDGNLFAKKVSGREDDWCDHVRVRSSLSNLVCGSKSTNVAVGELAPDVGCPSWGQWGVNSNDPRHRYEE
jgi:hypothetical protein